MFKSPESRYVVRAALVGLLAFFSALQAHLPGLVGEDLIDSFISGFVSMCTYLGIGYATPVEPKVGMNQRTDTVQGA